MDAIRERLLRSTGALEAFGVPYAVVGGNAVAAWVSSVDEDAIRTTKDVDILVRREDYDNATIALASAGFVRAEVMGVTMFLDGPQGKPSSAVHILAAKEKVRPEYVEPAPDVTECLEMKHYKAVTLEALIRMKLTSFRDRDRTHLRDMIGVRLIDATWPARFHPVLADRLQMLLNDPDG